MSRLQTSFVLAYHGCEYDLGMRALQGEVELLQSTRKFDWLGSGAYFWEGDPVRAKEWAEQKKARGDYQNPFVIGAAIDLGHCLDLLSREDLELVRFAAESFASVRAAAGLAMPKNEKAPKDDSDDLVMRFLDCAVINHLHEIIEGPSRPAGLMPFDTVRAVFTEGKPLYEGGGIADKTHCQIAVRNPACIKGIFLPR